MASFGRRPAKVGGALGGSTKRTSGSDAFQRMQEEEAARERFAKEFEERKHCKEEVSSASIAPQRDASPPGREANPRVFLEIEVRGQQKDMSGMHLDVHRGRLEFELRADIVPKTAENFRCLCTGERGKSLSFEESIFHRIIPGFMAQGGDITDRDGTGGKSIYGKEFADENFSLRHERSGTLSMANSGKNTNNSQFFILFKETPHLNGKHVVFGNLLRDDGRVLQKMAERGTKSGDVRGMVVVTRCGELPRAQERSSRSERQRSRSRGRRRSRSNPRKGKE